MASDLQREHDELELMRQRREVMFWTLRQWVALAALVVTLGLLTLDYFKSGEVTLVRLLLGAIGP